MTVSPAQVEPALENGFFRVGRGRREQDAAGWIARADVVVWPHRQGIGFTPSPTRKSVLLYKSMDDLRDAYLAGASSRPRSAPQATEVATASVGPMLLPLLETFELRNPSGDEMTVYRVVPLSGSAPGPAPAPQGAAPPKPRINLKAATLDVVFVIDTTTSMQPEIDAIKEVVRQLARKFADDPDKTAPLRFGLVAYRDRIDKPDPSWYVTKVFWDLNRTAETTPDSPGTGTKLDEFLQVLDTVTDAKVGSEDVPEDVLGGLREAIKLPGWNPNGFKHIILIGDASGHVDPDDPRNPEKLTIEGIKAMMQPPGSENVNTNILCHAFRAVGEDPADGPRAEEQFRKLAEGHLYPGMYAVTKPNELPRFMEQLVELINDTRTNLRKMMTDPKAVGGAPAAAPANVPGGALLREFIAAAGSGPGPDPGEGPALAPGFLAATDLEGKEQVEPYLLVEYGALSLFRSTLSLAVNALKQGDPASRDTWSLVRSLQVACVQLSTNESLSPDLPADEFLKRVLGLPVKNDLFKVTPQLLESMTAEDFEQWTKRLQASDSIIAGYLENPKIWRTLAQNAGPDSRQAFVRISDLP
jgi:hypothetical protein